MNLVTQIFAVLAGIAQIYFWVLESLLIGRPAVHKGIFGQDTKDLPVIKLWAVNMGYYNLFLAAAPLGGVLIYHWSSAVAGKTLVAYGCGFIFLAGIVLVLSDRKFWRGALAQTVPPAVALLALAF
jgi:putative membrane protein